MTAPRVAHRGGGATHLRRRGDLMRHARWGGWAAIVGLFLWSAVAAELSAARLVKLYSEAIEAIDRGPVEAVEAAGATRLQVLRWGVLPQLVPQFLSFTLYRFETNIRAAAILGFVGAGGIGFYIQTYLRTLNYPAASTVLLVLIVLVMAVDFTSSQLRARLVCQKKKVPRGAPPEPGGSTRFPDLLYSVPFGPAPLVAPSPH